MTGDAGDDLRFVSYESLRDGLRPSGRVVVEGAGVLRSLDFTGWNTDELILSDRTGLWSEILPRPLKPARAGRDIPLFMNCDFSGMSCSAFNPGIARFVGCRFIDVRIEVALGTMRAHFEECRFTGTWEGNFDARPATRDPAPRVSVRGNSFVGCTGFGLQGGIARSDNTFDPLRHVIIERGGRGWEGVCTLARHDVDLAALVSSLEGRGPFNTGQDWLLVEKGHWSDDLWARLREATGSADRV